MTTNRLPSIPSALAEAARRDRLVVLVGAGASFGSGLPSWEALLTNLVTKARGATSTPEHAELVAAAERAPDPRKRALYLEKVLGAAPMRALVAQSLNEDAPQPTDVHRALARLPGALFVTTNYDDLLERALREQGRRPRVVVDDPAEIHAFDVGDVFKLHGDVHRPLSIVLAMSDYDRMLDARSAAWRERFKTFLQSNHQLLLVGYGYGDEDVRRVVQELRDAYPAELVRPFWLNRSNLINQTDADDAGLELIGLESYDDIPAWLDALGHAARRDNPAVLLPLYRDEAWAGIESETAAAVRAYEAGRYAESASSFRTLRERAATLMATDPSDRVKHRWRTSTMNLIGSLLAQDDRGTAVPMLRELTTDLLEASPAEALDLRLRVASTWAQLGEVDLAETVITTVPLDERGETGLLVRIVSGEVPDPLPTSPLLVSQIAMRQARAGDYATAAQAARAVSLTRDHDVAPAVNAVSAAVAALFASALQSSLARSVVPIAERAGLLAWTEATLDGLRTDQRVPPHVRPAVERLAVQLYKLTSDVPRFRKASECLETLLASAPQADGSTVAPAMTELPLDPTLPWQPAFHAALDDLTQGRLEQAERTVMHLLRDWPEVSVLWLNAGIEARDQGRYVEALKRAEASERLLPGRGARLLRAQCLGCLGRRADCFHAVEPLLREPPVDPEALRLAAWSRLDVAPAEAADLYQRYLETPPAASDPTSWVVACRALVDVGRHDDALATAARALERIIVPLDAKILVALSDVPRLEPTTSAAGTSFLREVYERLGRLAEVDPQASQRRYTLYHRELGSPDDLEPPDPTVAIDAGLMRPVSLDELVQIVRDGEDQAARAWRLWRAGWLPYEVFTKWIQRPTASVLTSLLGAGEFDDDDVLLRPSHPSLDFQPNSMRGARLLLGDLEIYLLVELGLWEALRDRLGAEGRLMVFQDVWNERLRGVATELRLDAQPAELAQLEALERWLTGERRLNLITSPEQSDEEVAAAHQATVIAEHDEGVSTHAWLQHLVDRGELRRDLAARLLGEQPVEATPLPAGPVVLSYPTLRQLWVHHLLDDIVGVLPAGTVIVGPRTWHEHRARLRALQQMEQAASRAERVRDVTIAARDAGWLEVVPRPDDAVDALLPPASTPKHEGLRALTTRMMTWHYALHQDPSLLLLTADAAVGTNSLPIGLRDIITWTSNEQLSEVLQVFHGKAPRVIAFADLAVWAAPTAQRRDTVERLAELGFPCVFEPEDLLQLAREYRGLQGRARRLLQRSEWVARTARRTVVLTEFRLGQQYGRAIWLAWCGTAEQRRGIDARAFSAHLLTRLQALSQRGGPSLLEQGLMWLLVRAATPTEFLASFRRVGEDLGQQSRMTTDEETPAGALWAWLAEWSNQEPSRRRAWDRALHRAMVATLRPPDVHEAVAGVMLNTLLSGRQAHPLHLDAPGVREFTILSSASIGRRFLSDVTASLDASGSVLAVPLDIAVHAAAHEVETGFTSLIVEGLTWHIAVRLDEQRTVRAAVPPEAAVLYADPSASRLKAVALGWAHRVVHADARLAAAWEAFAHAPAAPDVRWALASAGASAAPVEIETDSLAPLTWGAIGPTVRITNLSSLRDMLGEPEGELVDLPSNLRTRIEAGGAWAEGPRQQLPRQACELPGVAGLMRLRDRLHDDVYAAEVAAAVERLRFPEGITCGALSSDLIFLRCAAALQPEVQHEGELLQLLPLLPEVVEGVLHSVLTNPQASFDTETGAGRAAVVSTARHATLAECEADWLRACGAIVHRLAELETDPGAPVASPLTQLWLTWRLYQWWSHQVATLPLDEQRLALRRLTELRGVADWSAASPAEVLDPRRFAPSAWDHRLAIVLSALHVSGGVARELLFEQDRRHDSVPDVLSTAARAHLLELTQRPCTEAERHIRHLGEPSLSLGWRGPVAVPDLAVLTLLRADPAVVLRLTPAQQVHWLDQARLAEPESDRMPESCARVILRAFASRAHLLEPPVFEAWHARLSERQDADDEDLTTSWVVGMCRLLAAGRFADQQSVWETLDTLLSTYAASPAWPQWLAEYLFALSHARPDQFAETWERWHQVAGTHDAAAALLALGAVLTAAPPATAEVAASLLTKHVQLPPFQDDDRVRALAALVS